MKYLHEASILGSEWTPKWGALIYLVTGYIS
nr:MAG TPA: hypothetical protein [Caudoviricetes sp.]